MFTERKECDLTVILPCLNESKTLGRVIKDAKAFILTNDIDGEVLVCDNYSTDDSVKIAKSLGARVIKVYDRGYGNAVKTGFKYANGKYIIVGDSDLSYDMYDLYDIYKGLCDGNDFVFGDRYKGFKIKGASPFLHRYIGVPVLSYIARVRNHCDIHDFHCGKFGTKREFINKLNIKSSGFEFTSEVFSKVTRRTNKYIQVPVTLYPDGRHRKPHLSTFRDGLRHLAMILFGISL